LESFLLGKYAGLGRHMAREIALAALLQEQDNHDPASMPEKIFSVLSLIKEMSAFKPAIKRDLTCYTVFSFSSEQRDADLWKPLPAVNDLVDEYYRTLSILETYNQTRERMLSEARSEVVNFESRLKAASDLLDGNALIDQAKCYGDLILSNLHDIKLGQTSLECTNFYADPPVLVSISLQPNLNAVQNAQLYYRQFAKARSRRSSAKLAWEEAQARLLRAQTNLAAITVANNIEELHAFKRETFVLKPPPKVNATQSGSRQRPKTKLLTLTSADGWTIYVGRNRHENDYLMSRVAQPNDIWFHILGQSGAHVVVKVSSAKQEPPLSTLKEAALAAARFSKTAPGTKVRVVYTHCRNIKKAGSSKPGVVRYENEKTLEVDTSDSLVGCKNLP
jgi:predicted ribosome quality control (RQC) complex YloA/Tae2 family protein